MKLLGPLFVDLTKGEEECASLQRMLRQKRKGVERVALATTSDTLDPTGKIPKTESQEGELRQGRRIYAIVGSPHAGYSLQRKSNTARTGTLKLHEME